MITRSAESKDTPAIVQLLKESLGESLLKKTAEIWHYKHHDNPFGRSFVLLAEENDQFIGVRAFMQWRWQKGTELLIAYRAVDTATHPKHQGKGIFKKLTLQAVSEVQSISKCFIFNTPNDKSRPGYLKMGWEVLGTLRLSLVPTVIYAWMLLQKRPTEADDLERNSIISKLCQQHNQALAQKNVFFTPKSAAYLSWRYSTNPLQDYFVFVTPDYYVACYVKQHKYFRELRVAEVIGAESKNSTKELQRYLIALAFQHKCLLLSTADKNLFSLGVYGTFGPQLTCRDLTTNQFVLQASKNLDDWQYSLGDLELF
jgi:N-acetylglutamate synthase-like GNAT family acetyltransferase